MDSEGVRPVRQMGGETFFLSDIVPHTIKERATPDNFLGLGEEAYAL